MKKWTAMIVALMLLVTLATAGATTVPSISTSDTTQSGAPTASTGAEISSDFSLGLTTTPETIQEEILKMYEFVNGSVPKQTPANYFSDEVQQMIADKLPEAVPLDTLEVNEIVALDIIGYDTAYGDVTVDFTFATLYEADKAVLVLVGLVDADGNIVWVAVDAVVKEDGSLAVTFTQNVCQLMEQAAEIMMVVLNEQ